ncbi:MAG: F0F1 ATP synthase subunit A [Candidatus Magasanikbacteria bacterium]
MSSILEFFQVESKLSSVQPATLFEIAGLPITNAMLTGVVVSMGLIIATIYTYKNLTLRVNKYQATIEATVEYFFNLTKQIMPSEKSARQLLPLVGAILIYFGFSNMIDLVPGVSAFNYGSKDLFRAPTNDFNMTFSIGAAVVLLAQLASIKEFGPLGYVGKFIKVKQVYKGFRSGLSDGLMELVNFGIGLIDILSEIAKAFSLSLRLFGNMYAGAVLMTLLLGAFAFAVPTVWLAFSLLVAVIQALVFGALAAAYYAVAIQDPEPETG